MTDPIETPIDPAALDTLRRFGGEKLLGQMAALFLSSVPPRLATAREAARVGDTEGLRRAAHSLKSSAAQLGAVEMQRHCDRAESLSTARAGESLAPLVADIEIAFGAAREALERVLAQMKTEFTASSNVSA